MINHENKLIVEALKETENVNSVQVEVSKTVPEQFVLGKMT